MAGGLEGSRSLRAARPGRRFPRPASRVRGPPSSAPDPLEADPRDLPPWTPEPRPPPPRDRGPRTERGWDPLTPTFGAGVLAASAGAVLYVGLGVWVGTLAPRPRRASLLAAFLILFGLTFVPAALLPSVPGGGSVRPLVAALWYPVVVSAWAVALGLAAAAPRPLQDRRLLWTALGGGFLLALAGAVLAVAAGGSAATPVGGAPLEGAPPWVATVGHTLGLGFLYAAGILLALRAQPSREPGPGEVAELAVLAVALAIPVVVPAGAGVSTAGRALGTGEGLRMLDAAAEPAAWLLVAGLWGRNMWSAGEGTVRSHRWAFHGILGSLAVGAVTWSVASNALAGFSLLDSLVVILGAGLLGYGILRHGLAGLDVTVRWGAPRATVAGVAVATFVAASLGALLLSGEAGASLQLGVLAACASLVAWWILDPDAERVAGPTPPGSGPGGAGAIPERRHLVMYKAMVQRFMDDGGLSPREEQAFANIARKLDLDPAWAEAIRKGGELEGTEPPHPDVQVPDPEARAGTGSGANGGREALLDGAAAALAGAGADREEHDVREGFGEEARTQAGDGASEETASADAVETGSERGRGGAVVESEEAPGSASPEDDGGADGDRPDGSPPSDGSLEGRMDLRRNEETGEVEMVIHETPWGEVRVDLGEVPDGG